HSTGAGAIVWSCHIDTRCKAALAQDGWYEPIPPDVLSTPLQQPIMLMQSETTTWQRDNIKRLADLYQTARADVYHLKLTGVQHLDFSDYPLFGPHSLLLSNRGTLDGARTVQVIDSYLLAFFDKYLKNEPASLLNGPSPDFPEVQFESHSP
ncbi:MAG TPA: hypothetical protein VFK30_12555, partial [Anaerolineae bacterium]|nr:hypothetical protein [Anaerolineae bacterium]